MKRLFWIVVFVASLLIGIGIVLIGSEPGFDPGTRASPTLDGLGTVGITAGSTLALTVLLIAAWWQGVSRTSGRIRRERPGEFVFVAQSSKKLRELVSKNGSGRPISTYVVCVVGNADLELWAYGRLAFRVSFASIRRITVGTVFTSRPVPGLVIEGEAGTFELVPGRPGWELFPMLNVAQVEAMRVSLLDQMRK